MIHDDAAIEPDAFFKNDSARHIDHVIDYFAGAPAGHGDDPGCAICEDGMERSRAR